MPTLTLILKPSRSRSDDILGHAANADHPVELYKFFLERSQTGGVNAVVVGKEDAHRVAYAMCAVMAQPPALSLQQSTVKWPTGRSVLVKEARLNY